MKLLVIIPAYNEAESIARVVDELRSVCPGYDYVVVNDGSADATARICRDNGYNLLDLPVNLGIGGCMQCGYRYAQAKGYDIAVQFDGDGQHNPGDIAALAEPLLAGAADIAVGSRFLRREGFQTTWMRRAGITCINAVIRLCCGAKMTDCTSGFRAANRRMIALFAEDYAEDYPEPSAIVAAVLRGATITEVPTRMNERSEGISSINTLRSIYYMIKVPFALLICRLGTRKRRSRA